MIQSFIRMRTARLGFDPSRVPPRWHGRQPVCVRLGASRYDALTEQVGSLSGVVSVGAIAAPGA
jgi:hypothetical protein